MPGKKTSYPARSGKAKSTYRSARSDSAAAMRRLGHDLNNALAPANLYAGLLKSMTKDEKSLAMLGNIEECVKRAAAIAEELLALGHDVKNPKPTCDKSD